MYTLGRRDKLQAVLLQRVTIGHNSLLFKNIPHILFSSISRGINGSITHRLFSGDVTYKLKKNVYYVESKYRKAMITELEIIRRKWSWHIWKYNMNIRLE
jgi:hypothetical protein